ncbi:MAG: PTS sugar transporter subunit IIA [Planctomycetota bacterium]
MIRAIVESSVLIENLAATTSNAVVDELLGAVVAAGKIAKPKLASIKKSLAERESKGSTGIGNGVAVPHVKTDAVSAPVLAFGRSNDGISDWHAIDGRDVHLVFLILAPTHSAEQHLALLRWISTLARDADFRRFARAAEDADALRELMREMIRD